MLLLTGWKIEGENLEDCITYLRGKGDITGIPRNLLSFLLDANDKLQRPDKLQRRDVREDLPSKYVD